MTKKDTLHNQAHYPFCDAWGEDLSCSKCGAAWKAGLCQCPKQDEIVKKYMKENVYLVSPAPIE